MIILDAAVSDARAFKVGDVFNGAAEIHIWSTVDWIFAIPVGKLWRAPDLNDGLVFIDFSFIAEDSFGLVINHFTFVVIFNSGFVGWVATLASDEPVSVLAFVGVIESRAVSGRFNHTISWDFGAGFINIITIIITQILHTLFEGVEHIIVNVWRGQSVGLSVKRDGYWAE